MNKQEAKYIIYSGIFAFFYFSFILPWAIKRFDGNSAYTQFFLFNIGLYLILFVFLKSAITNVGTNLRTTFGLLSLFLALDAWMPEYHVSIAGELIKGASVGVGSTDYVMGLLGQGFHLSGIWLYGFVYIIAPVSLFLLAGVLLDNFVRRL